MLLYEECSKAIIGAAMEVHRLLGPGFLEAVYENALAHEFRIRQIPFVKQATISITYKHEQVGGYRADFIVYDKIILEIKSASRLAREHEAQALHYLAAMQFRLALLLNFGAPSLQIRRIIK